MGERRHEKGGDAFMSVFDDGEVGVSCGGIGGVETAREVGFHIRSCEGAVGVERDSTWACVVIFLVDEVAWFSRRWEHDVLFGLVGS